MKQPSLTPPQNASSIGLPIPKWLESINASTVKDATGTATSDATIAELLDGIRSGKWKDQVERIRDEYARAKESGRDPKSAVRPSKLQLPGVMWSGRFSSRVKPADEKLVAHSGILCADLDDIPDGQLAGIRAKFATSPHAVAVFLSPTGSGLKALFWVPADASRHLASFGAVKAHVHSLTGLDIDPACKDVSRLCFVSYDHDLWVNPGEVQELTECTHNPHTVVVLGGCGVESLGASVDCVSSVYTIEGAVKLAVMKRRGGTHRKLCKLAGALLAFEKTTGKTIEDGELRGIFLQWYSKSKPHLDHNQHENEYYVEFLDAQRNVKRPLTESLPDRAWKLAQASPTPPEAEAKGLTSPAIRLFVSFVRQMQLLSGKEPFALSPYTVMDLFGQRTHSTACKWIGALQSRTMKILTLIEPGNFIKGLAATYRFNFDPEK